MDEALRKAGLFQGVDPDDIEALASEFEIIEASRGHVLFHEGEPGDSLYIVLSGKVKLGRRASDGRENLVATRRPGMARWRVSLFSFMSRNAQPATKFFNIPPDRVMEIGAQIEL